MPTNKANFLEGSNPISKRIAIYSTGSSPASLLEVRDKTGAKGKGAEAVKKIAIVSIHPGAGQTTLVVHSGNWWKQWKCFNEVSLRLFLSAGLA